MEPSETQSVRSGGYTFADRSGGILLFLNRVPRRWRPLWWTTCSFYRTRARPRWSGDDKVIDTRAQRHQLMRTPLLLSFTFVTLSLNCTGVDSTASQIKSSAFALPPVESFESLQWTGTPLEGEPVVAVVEGTPISLRALQRQLSNAPDETTADTMLDKMVEFELLARRAYKSGYYNQDTVGDVLRRTMARRWVEHTFAEELRPDTMPQSGIDEVFAQAKGIYDHFTRFHVVDAQVLCCTSMSDQDSCYRDLFDSVAERREHLALCFEQLRPQMEELRSKLVSAKTAGDFRALFDTWSPDYVPVALRDTFQLTVGADTYRFQYDINTPYAEQFKKVRYRMFYEEIMEGAKQAWLKNGSQVPLLSPLIQSPIGFHLLFVYQVDPERHLESTAPEVQADIRKNAFEPWRKAFFARTMADYCGRVGCEVNRDGLLLLQEAQDRIRTSKSK